MIRKTSVLRIDKLILMISLGLVRDTPTLSKLRHLYDRNISLSFKSIYLAKKFLNKLVFPRVNRREAGAHLVKMDDQGKFFIANEIF